MELLKTLAALAPKHKVRRLVVGYGREHQGEPGASDEHDHGPATCSDIIFAAAPDPELNNPLDSLLPDRGQLWLSARQEYLYAGKDNHQETPPPYARTFAHGVQKLTTS